MTQAICFGSPLYDVNFAQVYTTASSILLMCERRTTKWEHPPVSRPRKAIRGCRGSGTLCLCSPYRRSGWPRIYPLPDFRATTPFSLNVFSYCEHGKHGKYLFGPCVARPPPREYDALVTGNLIRVRAVHLKVDERHGREQCDLISEAKQPFEPVLTDA